jgi:radical SAM protein with 4Fe4S-binding SPASM domain
LLLDRFSTPIDTAYVSTLAPDARACVLDLVRAKLLCSDGREAIRTKWISEIQERFASLPTRSEGVVFLITSICNFACGYCIAGQDTSFIGDATPNMLRNTVAGYISFLRSQQNGRIAPVIAFSGGEPTLRFDLMADLCRFNRSSFPDIAFRYRVITNASRIDDEIASFLRDYDFDVVVSIDVNQERSRRSLKKGKGNAWHRALAGLETLVRHECRCSVSTVLSELETFDEMKDFVRLMRERGVREISINPDNCRTIENPEGLAELVTGVSEFGTSEGIAIGGAWQIPAKEVFSKNSKRDRLGYCSAASRVSFFVRPDGTITYCDYLPEIIGHVDALPAFFERSKSANPDLWGMHARCEDCEIEGFCSPCRLEEVHLHRSSPKFMEHRCRFFRACFRRTLATLCERKRQVAGEPSRRDTAALMAE